jgi:hypothetical protein
VDPQIELEFAQAEQGYLAAKAALADACGHDRADRQAAYTDAYERLAHALRVRNAALTE